MQVNYNVSIVKICLIFELIGWKCVIFVYSLNFYILKYRQQY